MPNLTRGVDTSFGAAPSGAASNYGLCLQAKRHSAAHPEMWLDGSVGSLRSQLKFMVTVRRSLWLGGQART
jgi:hypothetical protein